MASLDGNLALPFWGESTTFYNSMSFFFLDLLISPVRNSLLTGGINWLSSISDFHFIPIISGYAFILKCVLDSPRAKSLCFQNKPLVLCWNRGSSCPVEQDQGRDLECLFLVQIFSQSSLLVPCAPWFLEVLEAPNH